MDYLNPASKFDGKTIKLPILLDSVSGTADLQGRGYQLILDTGADSSALTERFLIRNGYTNFQKTGTKKRTATGEAELFICQINGMTIAKQFKIRKMNVDVLSGWEEHAVVGVIVKSFCP